MSDKDEIKEESDKTIKKEYDPTLDIESDKFDPLKAVFSKDFAMPAYKNLPVYDNIQMIQAEFNRLGSIELRLEGKKSQRQPGTSSTSTKPGTSRNEPTKTVDEFGLPIGRRFLPHQG